MDLHTPQPTSPCHIVALPFPGRGHINPMMCLCHSIAAISPATTVSFIVTEEWLGFIGVDPKPDNVRFVTIPQVIPSEIGRGKDSPTFYETVLNKIRAPVEELLDRLEPPITVLIADTYLVWSVEVGNVRNIPVASLWTMSASVYSVFHYFDLLVHNQHFPVNLAEKGDEWVDYIPGLPSIRVSDLPTCFHGKGLNVLDIALESVTCLSKAQYLLLPSVYEVEPEVIDALKQSVPIPVYHVGPTIPFFKVEDYHSRPNEDHYFEWLDNQPRGSVLYVSQGSLHSVPHAQMDEIAAGLKASGARFFWVAREQVSELKEKCGDMGIVVPWCDQLTVLCHSSLGGFWSHCGWNSTSEAVFAGLPMLTFPIYWDQVPNSKMIVEDWKIGWRVKGSGEDGLVSRQEIAELVRRFMDSEDKEGKEMRRRARQLSEIYRQAVRKGGSTSNSVEAFISDISKMI